MKKLNKMLERIQTQSYKQKKLSELFIKAGGIKKMPNGERKEMAILRISMIAELDASNFYEMLANISMDERVKKVLLDISEEEKVHAGEFSSLLNEIDPEYEEAMEKGDYEVEELI